MRKIRFLRRPEVQERFGRVGASTIGNRVRAKLLTRPVPLCGSNASRAPGAAVGWPEHEIDEITAAVLAGKSDTELRLIVERLEADRAVHDAIAA